MGSLNKVLLIGNAGKDAELRYTASGSATSQFSLAVNSRRKNAAGEWEDQTEWFNCVVFGERAERVSEHITKGKHLFVDGRLQTRSWSDDAGQKLYRTEVIVNDVQFLERRPDGSGSEGWGDSGGRGRGADTRFVDSDDLPFS